MILPKGQPVSTRHFLLNYRNISSGVLAQLFIQEKASSPHCLQKKYRKQQASKLKMEENFKSHHIHKMLVSRQVIAPVFVLFTPCSLSLSWKLLPLFLLPFLMMCILHSFTVLLIFPTFYHPRNVVFLSPDPCPSPLVARLDALTTGI